MSRRKRPVASPAAPVGATSAFRVREMFLFPATAFGLLLMLAGAACPVQLARWEAEDRAAIAAGAALAPGTTPDALRPSTLLLLSVLPLVAGIGLVARGYRQARNEFLYGHPNPDLRVRDADVLYDAGRQLPKVRLVMWLAMFCAVGGTWWGVLLARTFGLSPGDGGVLRPLPTRLAVGSVVAGLGLAFAAAMLFYGRQYVAEIRRGPGPGELVIRTVRLIGTRAIRLRAGDVRRGRRHDGEFGGVSAAAPFGADLQVRAAWHAVTIPGRRLALIVDDQGWFRGDSPSAIDSPPAPEVLP